MIEVTDLVAPDREAWAPLWQEYLTFYRTSLAPEVTDATWDRLTDADQTATFGLGARLDGRLVGFAHVTLASSTWSTQLDAYLEDLAVAGDVRGLGVGAALIAEIERRGREHAWRKIHWVTEDDNLRAQRLYDHVATRTNFVRYELSLGDEDGSGS